ncbi:hypothetical protein V6x_04060 [Gimesia chilikensis]|uniref:Uncharacterized protein n=1 Tax=Gimesia chilikensis TaxID=2605989 RepID=A0A517W668_9PLAN|nr:hypothetical protein [Gimesia chilikensis]QDU00730.1 hypothetical protein V6x_04060 [Gimesia chilikensis]
MNPELRCLTIISLLACLGCGGPAESNEPDGPLQLHLASNEDGSLKQVTLNGQKIGNDDNSFRKFESAVAEFAQNKARAEANGWIVDINADEQLRFEFVHRAIDLCAGSHDEKTEEAVNRIKKVRLVIPESDSKPTAPRELLIPVQPQMDTKPKINIFPEITVRLTADVDGSLKELQLGNLKLGNDNQSFDKMNHQILKLIGKPGNQITKDLEITFDADKALRYQHVIQAFRACSGRPYPLKAPTAWIPYIEKFKFTGIGNKSNELNEK